MELNIIIQRIKEKSMKLNFIKKILTKKKSVHTINIIHKRKLLSFLVLIVSIDTNIIKDT